MIEHLSPQCDNKNFVLVAASGVEDEEIADAYHSKLREGDSMKVLGIHH